MRLTGRCRSPNWFNTRCVAPSASISRRRPATAATIRISFPIAFRSTHPKRISQHDVCGGSFGAALPVDDFLNKKRHRSLGYQHRGVHSYSLSDFIPPDVAVRREPSLYSHHTVHGLPRIIISLVIDT